jgi:small GTP-binding protein
VDAGKTTLSEALLYGSGTRRTLGRVDHRDAFLDTHTIERSRGITIFSKQALLETPRRSITLLDTPGHVDFSPEAERVLPTLDCAVLVISGTDGVQAHTKTLWELLARYQVRRCFYGHLHGPSHKLAMEGLWDNVEYRLVSADFLDFKPMRVI